MVYFTIALRSKESTDRWEQVLADFEATLHSIFNQTCNEFHVYVGCNDKPNLSREYDHRLRFVCVNTPKPNGWLDGCRDRAWKQLACCAEIKKDLGELMPADGIYIFPVDADDLISNRIAAFAMEHPHENGFKSPDGYRWNKGERRMEISPYFGGSMNIMKLRPCELPDDLPDISLCFDKETCAWLNGIYPIRWNDIEVEEKMAQLGRPLTELPFRSTIYVLNTGANISSHDPRKNIHNNHISKLRLLRKKLRFWRYKQINKSIQQEFGMIRANQ